MPDANELLRAARLRIESPNSPGSPLSRQELADAVNAYIFRASGGKHVTCVDANHIGKWERGVIRWPAAHYRAALRAVLDVATDRDLGFEPPRRGENGDTDPVNRKQFLATALGLGAGAILGRSVAPAHLFETGDLLDALAGPTAHFRRMEQSVPSPDLSQAVEAHLALATRLVDQQLTTSAGFAVLAEVAGLAAWLAADRGDHGTARRRYAESIRYAQRAHHPLLAAYMTASTGHFAVECGDPRHGAGLLDRARAQLDAAAPPQAHAWLASLEAVARARLADRSAALRALHEAETRAARADADPIWPWIFSFDAAKAARYRGFALAHLGDLRGAIEAFSEAGPALTTPKPRAVALVERAQVHARLGEIGHACRLAVDALEVGRRYGSERIIAKVRALRAEMPPRAPEAEDLDHALMACYEERV